MHPLCTGPVRSFALCLTSLAVAVLTPPPALLAQEVQPAAPRSVTELPEARALAVKARADYPAARVEYCRLLTQTCAEPGPSPERAALAELCALMPLVLMQTDGADPAAIAAIEAARTSPLARSEPALAGRLGAMLLDLRLRVGGEIASLAAELGVIDSFWVVGPFDNERGSGYGRSTEAERRFDPAATFDGKLRPVAWRRLPVAAPGGLLDMAGLMRPEKQVFAYVATAVVAPEPVDAALRLGSSGSVRVFLNGEERLARDVDRACSLDQDNVVLPLAAGPNLLVVKVCREEGLEWFVQLRLTALDGAPLAGVSCSDAEADLLAANDTAARAAAEGAAIATNALSFYPARAAAGDAAAALRLAAILGHQKIDGERATRARRYAKQATEGLPDCSEAPFLHFWAQDKLQRTAADSDDNEKRFDLAEVLRRDPDHVEARLLLSDIESSTMGTSVRAEEIAREVLALQPNSALGYFRLADALQRCGLSALSDRVLEDSQALPTRTGSTQRMLVQSRMRRRDADGALAAMEVVVQMSQRPQDLVYLSHLQLRVGKRDAAIAGLQATIALWPFARQPRAVLAELYAGEGDLDAALRVHAEWLQLCPEDDVSLLESSRLHGQRGDRERQVEALRAAVELNPNLRDEQRYLEYLTSDRAPFHAPYELDGDEVLAADGGPPADAAAAQDGLHHVLRQRVVLAHSNGTTSEYTHQITRVLREEGARQLATFRLSYYSANQRGRILSCKVRHADGTVEQPRLRGATVALPMLQPGDVVEVRGRVDDLAPTFFGDYFGLEHRFTAPDGAPVARSALTVVAMPGRTYRWQGCNGAGEPQRTPLDGGGERLDWELRDLPRDEPEPWRAMAKERDPLVRVTTYRDWNHFAGWWWNLIEKQIDVSPAMRDKVRELCADAASPAQKLDALYRFVVTDVRYEAWEFGVHGYKPYNTSVIFERRHGDCKDKALLLCALLREVSIVARPVLIYADERRSEDDLSLPLVHHFNHCIVWVPEQDGIAGHFLDGTAQFHPSSIVPTMDQGAEVLVVDRGDGTLQTVPRPPAAENLDAATFVVELRADGSAAVQMQQAPQGNAAVGLRYQLASAQATLRERLERQLLSRFGKVTMRSVSPSDPADLGAPAQLQANFDAQALAQTEGRTLRFDAKFDSRELQRFVASPERTAPLLLGAPWRHHERIELRLPPGMHAPSLPEAAHQRTPFGEYSLQWRREGDRVVVERSLEVTVPRVAAADYAALREFVAAVVDADSRSLVVMPQEDRR